MQVTKLWEDLDTDMKMMRLQWLYRPHDTAQGRVPDQVENSVCLSNHADDNPLDTFLAPAFVQFVGMLRVAFSHANDFDVRLAALRAITMAHASSTTGSESFCEMLRASLNI